MVRVKSQREESQKYLPVRFLVKEKIRKGEYAYGPWVLYRLPPTVLDQLNLPYEVMENPPLNIGSRIASMAKAMGFSLGGGGCCSGCSNLQKLLDAASPEWVQKHIDEIAEMMQKNARKSFKARLPKRMLKLAIKSAIVLERRALRDKHREMIGRKKK